MYVIDQASGELKNLSMEAYATDSEFLDALYECWTGQKRTTQEPTMLEQLAPVLAARCGRGNRRQQQGRGQSKPQWQRR